jgi:putative heme-binding domain-containing protein
MKSALPAILALFVVAPSYAEPLLELKKGDHVCIIGNTLADRMQHDGWLEAFIQARFADHELVFRNLGFSGDEVGGFTEKPDQNRRLRSQWFGSSDEWLEGKAPVPNLNGLVTRNGVRDNRFETTNTRADVIFAFFGYNESWAGEAGLDAFKKDLERFIKHTLAQKYNGKSAPRLVLFSPTAFEEDKTINLPDGRPINTRLKLYTAAMSEVAKANGVPFVDLFEPTDAVWGAIHRVQNPTPTQPAATINGVHLTSSANRFVAKLIDVALFGEGRKQDEKPLENIRQAVLDKNFYWFNRYRVLDGYNVYGGRAFEKYADRQSNYEDQQRELEILDVKTANRDRRVWAVAQGKDLKIDDSNCPPLIPVKTNRPEFSPERGWRFLGGEEAISKMTVAKNMKVSLFADEKMFPELAKPVQMQFDAKGRLWVAVWPTYPHWKPTEEMNDKILILEDTDGDGKADKVTVFADKLNCPTGFEFYNGGVLVAQAPDLWFLKDTDGDGKADFRQRVLSGIDSADSHHTANSFAFDPGGALYFQEGTFHRTSVEDPYGPPKRCADGGVFRYEPRAQKFDVYVSTGFANPHGHVWDRWGADIVYDGTGANPYHGALFSGHVDFPNKHPKPPQVYQQRTRPCPGAEILTSKHFPESMQGNLLVGNVITVQGILQYRLEDKGASLAGTEVEPIVTSTDPNFRPSDLKVGPDGAIWFIDWHNPIIGHLQHAIRDPNRDRTHGRIYRITYEGRELSKSPKIDGAPVAKLLELLKEPEDRVRYRVRTELAARKTDDVIPAVKVWIEGLQEVEKRDPNLEHHLMEALWLHQSHNVVNKDLLVRMLTSNDFHARAAATRVLCYWRDRVPEALELLKQQASDAHPRVRMEAIRAASFFNMPEAMEIVIIAAELPTDVYLDFVRGETTKVLGPVVQNALAKGQKINFTTQAGARYLLRNEKTETLLKMERNRPVCLELLYRTGVPDDIRRAALRDLAKHEGKPELKVLLDAIGHIDDAASARVEGRDDNIVFELIRLLQGRNAAELGAVRADLEKLATTAKKPLLRQVGYVAMINVDGSPEKAWALAVKSVNALRDLLAAMPLIADPGARAALYPKVEPLLNGLPPELAAKVGNAKGVAGRFVRIDLKGRQTLSLAEVQVFSGDKNVALKKKATQKDTAHGGTADKAVDGETSGIFGMGSITHTAEKTLNPWWEVDLGDEYPIDKIVIWNRTEGDLVNRLNNFNLHVLDANRREVFKQENNSAPPRKAEFELGGSGPVTLVRHAAMDALTTVRGEEAKTFQTLAKFIKDDADRAAAVHALQRIPRKFWPKEEAPALVESLLGAIRKVPAAQRTTPEALDALEFTDALASLLPAERAKAVRQELGELGVRVVRVYTLPERMSYDKEVLVVKAGKPVEFLFENTDLMPHNFVITTPGSMEEIGKTAEAKATDPAFAAAQFVPTSPKVLLGSRLLQPREAQKLSWVAPKEPGVYPYVCTYPGHWMRMHGALYVVEDLDAYQVDPAVYLTKHPLPIKDPLLKDRRPRTEWTYDDLLPAVTEMKGSRNFGNGKAMFQAATCVACHKMEGVGNEFGPDLTKFDEKWTKADILKEIIEPSARINEKFQTWQVDTSSGKKFTGLILKEDKTSLVMIENPLAKSAPVVIKADDVESRKKLPTSQMPKGLVDKLTRDEILDLIAYIYARANRDHELFKPDGHHHH